MIEPNGKKEDMQIYKTELDTVKTWAYGSFPSRRGEVFQEYVATPYALNQEY